MNNTKLQDRILWYDGDSTVEPEQILKYLERGMTSEGLCVTHVTPDLKQYNQMVTPNEQITEKTSCKSFEHDWKIPEKYNNLDIPPYITERLQEYLEKNVQLSQHEKNVRVERVEHEIQLFQQMNLFPVLRALIFIINTFRTKNIVWGVGRGSSVSSYVMFLIGIHDIDSVKYEIDIKDFLHPTD